MGKARKAESAGLTLVTPTEEMRGIVSRMLASIYMRRYLADKESSSDLRQLVSADPSRVKDDLEVAMQGVVTGAEHGRRECAAALRERAEEIRRESGEHPSFEVVARCLDDAANLLLDRGRA